MARAVSAGEGVGLFTGLINPSLLISYQRPANRRQLSTSQGATGSGRVFGEMMSQVSSACFRALAETASDLFFLVREDGGIIDVNDRAMPSPRLFPW